jgi:hypothetical protein
VIAKGHNTFSTPKKAVSDFIERAALVKPEKEPSSATPISGATSAVPSVTSAPTPPVMAIPEKPVDEKPTPVVDTTVETLTTQTPSYVVDQAIIAHPKKREETQDKRTALLGFETKLISSLRIGVKNLQRDER